MLAMEHAHIHINGIVQGVGFRPFVTRLARELGVRGTVLNSTSGVDVQAWGSAEQLDELARRLVLDAPPAALILSLEREPGPGAEPAPEGFQIVPSAADSSRSTLVSPDLATCPDCLAELLDPANRRYRYPFINCTNCGPRFTIINDLPYDRPLTSMAPFAMCPSCADEYACEQDRRYHAQPDACFECGPMLRGGSPCSAPAASREESDALIEEAAQRLLAGQVIAVKGLGGWHLSADATNQQAVQALRERKRRPSKPLACMVAAAQDARLLCQVSAEEEALLESPAHPIVLMPRREGAQLAPSVAGELPELGLMLPSTPLQHLLCRAVGRPLVMTSGNRSGEPIVAADEEAQDALGHIAEWFLGNNRAIVARYDDSVARVLADGSTQMVRRARGYAPAPLFVPGVAPGGGAPVVFAAGPEQKATFCLLSDERAFVSQHLGDLESLGSWQAWEEAHQRYQRLFGLEPAVLACDLHPEYLSSKWARAQAAQLGLPLVEVQHHHAHIASVMGEHGLDEPVLGVALDGTGYGTDGTIWGCELLQATRSGFERLWHLPAFALPGGGAAVRDPRRTAFALLRAAGLEEDERFAAFLDALPNRTLLGQMLDKGINSPLCSSAGRLFDGMAALMGLVQEAGYDGEPACLLEARARQELLHDGCAGLFGAGLQLPAELLQPGHGAELLCWLLAPAGSAPLTASGLHARLAAVIIAECEAASQRTGIRAVALSGGCMVNRLLCSLLVQGLQDRGLTVYLNRELPPNDGCIAYGQAVVARARLMEV
ncbi:MAG: carbamoyltransferase HypF [Coriobacteriales bacterium]